MMEIAAPLSHLATGLWLLGALGFTGFSVWLSALDIATRRLPNRIAGWGIVATLGPLVASCLVRLPVDRAGALGDLADALGGAALLFIVFAILWRVSPSGVGGGDVKIAPIAGGALGFFAGWWAVWIGALAACAIAAVWGAILARRARSTGAGTGARSAGTVPFAVCLFAGAWVVLFGGLLLALIGAARG